MTRESLVIRAAAFMLVAVAMVGCRNGPPPISRTVTVLSSWPALTVPADIQRLAVFYPRSPNRDYSEAYHRLEAAVFQLKASRATLTVVDRFNLATVMTELRFQHAGAVMEDSAMRIGHLLGVDSVLLYAIEGPTLRDRVTARRLSQVRPITITTKIIRVESGEVVYLNVVMARIQDPGYGDRWWFDNLDYAQLSQEALERSITQTVVDLQQAFQ